ncbi:MAG: DUF1697 domain-containing protein [Spirochaetia bacterium]
MSQRDAGQWHRALLRGVNVGPANRVSMADLRALVEDLGYRGVRTLLNSGNVVFEGRGPEGSVAATLTQTAASRIQDALAKAYGISCRVIVITAPQLGTIVAENPLLRIATNPSRLLVAVLGEPASRSAVQSLLSQDWGGEALGVGSLAAYLWVPEGVVKSPLNHAVNKALANNVTGRNWATMLKLRDMVKAPFR